MASIFELLTQNDERTNKDSLLGVQTGSFRDIAGDILGSRKKKEKKATKYLAGALFLGLGDILTQNKMQKKFDAFTQNDTVARSKIKQEFEDYTNFMAKHNTYTAGGQRSWEDGLKTDIMSRYKDLSTEKINELYNTEAQNYENLFNRYTAGKFEGSLKRRKTYEELLAPYEEIAAKAKKQLNPENAGLLKNVFGNVLGIRDDADTVLKNAEEQTKQYFNSFNSAVTKIQKKYGFQPDEYLSDVEQVKRRKNEVQNRIIKKQEQGIDLTKDDFTDAISLGVNVSGYKHLDNLMTTDVDLLVESLQAEKALRNRNVENPREYLPPKQAAMLGRVFPETQEEIDAQEQKNDEDVRNRVGTTLLTNINRLKESQEKDKTSLYNKLNGLDGELTQDSDGNIIAKREKALFIDNVIEGAVALQNLDPITYKDTRKAYEESFNLQVQGLQDIGRIPQFFTSKKNEPRKYGTEYVDPKVITTPIVPETANQVAEYLNDYKYMQNNLKDDAGRTAVPTKEGQTFTVSDEDDSYEVQFEVVKDEDDKLIWVYKP